MSGKFFQARAASGLRSFECCSHAQGREIECKNYGFWSFQNSDVARAEEKGKTREKKGIL